MSAISKLFRVTAVTAVVLSSISSTLSVFAVNQEGGYIPPALPAHTATASTTQTNPFIEHLSTTNVTQLKGVLDKIYTKGASLAEDKNIAYLTKIRDGVSVLGKKSAYSKNEIIQNIVGYINFELTAKIGSLKNDNSFMDEFGNIINDAGVPVTEKPASTPTPTATGGTISKISYTLCAGFNGPDRGAKFSAQLIELPKNMSADAKSKASAYQQYISCTGNTLEVISSYAKDYNTLPGFYGSVKDSSQFFDKTDAVRDWEKMNRPIEYVFDAQGKLYRVVGVRYTDPNADLEKSSESDGIDSSPDLDSHGCLKGKMWWSDVEKACVEYYVSINRTDANMGSIGYKSGDYMLNWWTAGMSSCIASGAWSGEKATHGNIVISEPATPQTYTLTCTGNVIRNGRSVIATGIESVTLDPRPKITSLSVTGGVNDNGSTTLTTIKLGASATVRWTSANAEYCRIFDGATISYANGKVPANGSLAISPKESYSFTIQCTGDGGETQVRYFGINVR